MLSTAPMPIEGSEASANHTRVVLIEVDSDARLRHEVTLRAAGYHVRAFATCPGPVDLHYAPLVLADLPSFEALRHQQLRRLPPVVVVAEDQHAGVAACLQGAAAWAPAQGQPDYLVDTVGGVLHTSHGYTP